MQPISIDGESAMAIKLNRTCEVYFVSGRQNLDWDLPKHVHSLQVDAGLNLEFRLYRNAELLGTSKNGLLRCTPNSPELTIQGDVWSMLSGQTGEYSQKKTVALNKFGVHPGIRTDCEPVAIQFFSNSGEVCSDDIKIQLTATYYNIWLSKASSVFGVIGRWMFTLE